MLRNILDDDELGKVKFLRNEIRLEEKIISTAQPYLEGIERRRQNFALIQNDFPNPELIQSKMKELGAEEQTIKRQVDQSKQMLHGHVSVLRDLIEDKYAPRDVIDGARSDISRVNRFISGEVSQ